MTNRNFSLIHQVAQPKAGMAGKPPLLLLLHGFGSNEDDLFSLAPYLDERLLIVSARAPVTLAPMSYAWFSLGFAPEGVIINTEEAESSRQAIKRFIGEAVDYYQADPDAVYLMGFSQGAMMSLAVSLTFPGTAAGVVAMSGRILPQVIDMIPDRDALIGLPVFVSHGTKDVVLPIHHARDTKARLSELPLDMIYREYDMGHEVSVESLRDITTWLSGTLDAKLKGPRFN